MLSNQKPRAAAAATAPASSQVAVVPTHGKVTGKVTRNELWKNRLTPVQKSTLATLHDNVGIIVKATDMNSLRQLVTRFSEDYGITTCNGFIIRQAMNTKRFNIAAVREFASAGNKANEASNLLAIYENLVKQVSSGKSALKSAKANLMMYFITYRSNKQLAYTYGNLKSKLQLDDSTIFPPDAMEELNESAKNEEHELS